MSKGRQAVRTDWQMSCHAKIINTEETTLIHERAPTDANRSCSGTPIGCVVQLFGGTGEPWAWVGYVFTDHNRRKQGRRCVTDKMAGKGAKRECAAEVWAARVIEARHPDPAAASTDYGYGVGMHTRTYTSGGR